jgi:Peptidase A4 family
MSTSTKTHRFTKVAAAAAAAALAIGISACSAGSSAHSQTAGKAGKARGTAAMVRQAHPGGVVRPATPAQRARALKAFEHGHNATVSASGLSSFLPGVTQNWGGYQVMAAKTGQPAQSASATWVVPTVATPSPGKEGFSAVWVGIGGECRDVACHVEDTSLIQLGTLQLVSASGQTVYVPWYETLPQSETPLFQLRIMPGDTVSAGLAVIGAPAGSVATNGQTWRLWMTIRSPSGAVQQWSKIVSYDSSEASAEWIVENPTIFCHGQPGASPLANYHSVTFSNLRENGSAPNLGLSNLVIDYDPYGQLTLPTPTLLLHRTSTYWVPFVPKGSQQTQGRAGC